jgi:hypothetical protein
VYLHNIDDGIVFTAVPAYRGQAPITGSVNSVHFYLAGEEGRNLDFGSVNEAAHDAIFQAVVDALQALPNVGNVSANKWTPSAESFPPTP